MKSPDLPLRRAGMAITACCALLAAMWTTRAPAADAWPARSIRLIVPFEPGGSSDITARFVADELGRKLGQAIVVENLGGTGGGRGTDVVAKSRPDGYTLLWANVAPVAINSHLYASLPYDPVKDFRPITLATVFPNVLVVRKNLKAANFADFMKKSKGEFKDLSFGSAGNGSSTHLAGEWLKSLTGAQWLHVPFKGGGPALIAVAAGQVDMYFSAVPSAMPFIRSGQLRALATTGKVRDPSLPDLPTIAEAGLPEFEVINWNGLLAPAGTPDAVIDLLNRETVALLRSPGLKARLAAQGAIAVPMSPARFAQFIAEESAKWAKLVKVAHARIE